MNLVKWILLVFGTAVIVVLFNACHKPAETGKLTQANAFFAPQNQPDAQPYYQFAHKLATTINQGDPNFFNDNFDMSLLVATLLRQTGIATKTGHFFAQEVAASVDAGAQVVAMLQGTGKYTLLGISNLPTQPTAWFRVTANGTLNYHRVELTAAPQIDLIRIKDFCILSAGLSFSETLKMALLNILAQNNATQQDLAGLNKQDIAAVQHAALTDKITIAIHQKNYGKALKLLKELPSELAHDKMLLLQQINMGYHLKSEWLPKTVKQYEKVFPNDAAAKFSLLNLAMQQKDNAGIALYADEFVKILPDEAYLGMLQAQAAYNQGQAKQAETLIRKVKQAAQKDTDVYQAILVFLLDEERYTDVVTLLEEAPEYEEVKPLRYIPADKYAGFYNSDAFKMWVNKAANDIGSSNP